MFKNITVENQIALKPIVEVCYRVNILTASSNAALQRLISMAPGMWKKPYSDSMERRPSH